MGEKTTVLFQCENSKVFTRLIYQHAATRLTVWAKVQCFGVKYLVLLEITLV